MKKTLRDIANKLNQQKEPWVLAGNTAAVLQGAMIESKKLTIYTSRLAAYQLGDIFNEYRKEKVKYREIPPLAGHAGHFAIKDIWVRIIGEPEIFHDHKKFFIPLDEIFLNSPSIKIDDQDVNLLRLEWLLILGILGGDEELAVASANCKIDLDYVQTMVAKMGVSFYIKPHLENLLKKSQDRQKN